MSPLLYRVPSGLDVSVVDVELAIPPPALLFCSAWLSLSASQVDFVDVLDGDSITSVTVFASFTVRFRVT